MHIKKQKTMNRTVKTIGTALAIMLIALAMPTIASAQENQQPYIDAQAKAEREVTPDELYLSITIKESDYKGKKNLEEMQNLMIKTLRNNGINLEEALSLNFMGSDVSYKIFSKRVVPKSEAKYILKLSDAATMQKIIYQLEDLEISNIELVETKYSKAEQLNIELGIEAMKKAQEQARAFAGAIGQEIGKAISIGSWASQNSPQPRLYKSRAILSEVALNDSTGNNEPTISVSKLTFTVNVNVRFRLM